jgi:hypothetical protein
MVEHYKKWTEWLPNAGIPNHWYWLFWEKIIFRFF